VLSSVDRDGVANSSLLDWPRPSRGGELVSTRPIRLFGDPVLRTAADPVVDFDQFPARVGEIIEFGYADKVRHGRR